MTNNEQAFSVRFGWLGDSRVIALCGELDVSAVLTIEEAVAMLHPFEHVYVDCSEVTFADSSGLRALVSSNRQLKARHGGLHLIELSAPMVRILDLCRVDTRLRLFVTPELFSL